MQAQKGKFKGMGPQPLVHIAFWQALCFLLLIFLIWTAKTLNLPVLFFSAAEHEWDWFQAWILTAGIIIVGFITVGHTYVQERRMLRGLITVCSYCHRVEIEEKAWQQMEMFISERSKAEFTHGICPSCYEKHVRALESSETRPGEAPARG